MKLKSYKCSRPVDLSTAVERECDGHDYERGALEAAQYTASNTAEFLGKLVEMLHEKHVLSDEEVLGLLSSWEEA
jgi:hypothetical protein